MGKFWEQNPPEKYQGNAFLSAEDVQQLIKNSTVVEIIGINFQEGGKFGDAYQVQLNIEGDERIKSFTKGSVPSRDQMLDDMTTYFNQNGSDPVKVRFAEWGQAIGLEPVLE
jgi:hypothetical protein